MHNASVDAADRLGKAMGTKITIDYRRRRRPTWWSRTSSSSGPSRRNPTASASTANDVVASLPILKEDAEAPENPLVLFISTAPEGSRIPYISNNFYEQGTIEGKKLLKRIGNKGNVAIIHGVPTNSAHQQLKALNDLFKQYPGIKVVATGFDYDDVEKARTECARGFLSAHPELDGFAVVDRRPRRPRYSPEGSEEGREGEIRRHRPTCRSSRS